MKSANRLPFRRLGLSLLLTLLLWDKGVSNCRFEVPLCTIDSSNNSVAEYVIHGGEHATERICVNSNSPQTDPANLTVRVRYEHGGYGVFCTDALLDSSSVCATNVTLPDVGETSWMLFKAGKQVGENGTFALNFTIDGVLHAGAFFYYAPTGLHSLNSSVVTATAGQSLSLSWLDFDVKQTLSISLEDSEASIPSSTSLIEMDPWAECIPPSKDSFVELSRPRLVRYVTSSVNIEEAGIYTLSADETDPSSVRVVVTQVSAPPQLSIGNSSTLYVEQGSVTTIVCDIVGTLRPPAWYLDNVPLSSKPNFMIRQDGVTFPSTEISQSGWYTCSASNQWGRTEKDFLVIVGASAGITIPPTNLGMLSYAVQPGTAVIIPCSTQGIPTPDVEWFANDTEVDFITERISSALIIDSYAAEQVQFHCRATNVFGTVNSTSVLVTTLPSDNLIPSSPMDTSYDIASHESVNLTCSYNLTNQYHYAWTKDYLPFKSEMPGSLGVQVAIDGSVDGEASGYYCCEVKSNASVLLDTRCTIVNVRLPSTLQVEPSNTSIPVGRNVELLCAATTENGIDYPHLSWHQGGRELPEISTNSRLSYVQNEYGLTNLQIRNISLQDQDVYSCKGVNFVSKVSATAELRVVESACASNVLNSSSAEEDEEVVFSNWNVSSAVGGTGAAGIADVNGEKVFRLSYQGDNATVPEISQAVSLSESTSQVRLTARMRTSNSDLQPVIELTMANSTRPINLATLTLPFPSHHSWQWVMSAILEVPSVEIDSSSLRVTMMFVGSGELSNDVFFDDVCLEFVEGSDAPTVTPSSSSDLNLTFYLILIPAVAGLAAILAIVIFTFCVCCSCAVKRKKKREGKYQTKNEDVPLEKVIKSSKEMDSAQLTSFSHVQTEMRTKAEPYQHGLGEKPAQQSLIDGQKQVNHHYTSDPVARLDIHDSLRTSANQRRLEGSLPPQGQPAGNNARNPAIYMPLNPLSLENEAMYTSPGAEHGSESQPVYTTPNVTHEHKQVSVPVEVEEVYDEMPFPEDRAQRDEMYDIVNNMNQPSTQQHANSEENHYYI